MLTTRTRSNLAAGGLVGQHASPRTVRHDHGPFLIALCAGVLVRVLTTVAFPPAILIGDSNSYLAFLSSHDPYAHRPDGYPLLILQPWAWVTGHLLPVVITQHLLGMATATVLYALLRHWGVGRWPATLAVLPVLLDALVLFLEQAILSDTLFLFLLVVGLGVLGWNRRPGPGRALVVGLIVGVAVCVRLVGEPMLVIVVVYVLLVGTHWRRRVAAALLVVVGFAVPVGSYASFYHHWHGVYALDQFGAQSLFLRTTTFVECRKMTIPSYQRVLCPHSKPGFRKDPTYYGFYDMGMVPQLRPPPGVSVDEALRQFAWNAIRTRPAAYLGITARDFALNFDWVRTDRFEYFTASRWDFRAHITRTLPQRTIESYQAHGGQLVSINQPWADLIADYQVVMYLPGPAVLACLVFGLVGVVGVKRGRRSGLQPICLLFVATGVALLLGPDATAEFTWRYTLPALMAFPAAAALAWTAVRDSGDQRQGHSPSDTLATPSTD